MGYANTLIAIETYTPSDTIVAENAAVTSTNSLNVYVKLKEITLVSDIGSPSLFRFDFDMQRTVVGIAKGKIYRNGVAVGTEQSNAGGYATFTEDIVTSNWAVGDRIQLYGQTNNAGGTCEVRNFRIKGTGSYWENTL